MRGFLMAPAIFFVGAVLLVCVPAEAPTLSDNSIYESKPTVQVNVPVRMDAKLFYSAINACPAEAADGIRPKSAGGIVPHHAVASPLLAEFFANLAKSNPDIRTFVVLGPNHRNRGLAPVISCRANWQTSIGNVATDHDFLNSLEKENFLAFDEDNCIPDQTIQTLAPFVKYYFPQSEIAPLLFSSEEGRKKSLLFARKIIGIKSSETFLLASLDFSHYLSLEEAEEKDAFTAAAIEKKDYLAISHLDSDYVDSPDTLIAFLHAMELSGVDRCEILRHGNSAHFPGHGTVNTTSYFSMDCGR